MASQIRCLNDFGVKQFSQFIESLRTGENNAIPYYLLTDDEASFPLAESVTVEKKIFPNRFEFGRYLQLILKPLDRRKISLNDALWNWLALYFFDELCPESNGKRNPLQAAVYVIEKPFNYLRYYRHIVRTPWLAVSDHGNFAKVLLSSQGTRSEIAEQLGATQDIFGNRVIIAGAYKLYFNEATQKPKRGTGGKLGGSPRRLTRIIGQLSLTYDLGQCTPTQFLQLLPREFDKFKGKEEDLEKKPQQKKKGWKKLLDKLAPKTTDTASI
jgi:hypothetical protein